MRTVLYARFSSTLQNSRSIEDQVALLRERCERESWQVVDVFTDYAISGAAGIDENARPGLNALLQRVEAGGVDQVLAEATDRIARHQGDVFAIRERIVYAGARLFTLSDGEVTEITAAFKGLMDAQFRKELGAKIKRGQRGAVKSGRAPAGLAYGYRRANRLDPNGNLVRGLREINEDEAEIVRRIFREYAANISPRQIAERLNEEGIPGPHGRSWRVSTINGDRQRKNGMLQNRLYAGVLVHNRTTKVTDPRTRIERIKPNPESEWVSEPVPELRIVPEDLWDAVQERRKRIIGIPYGKQKRPRRLLSGMCQCGICGGTWTVIGLERWGCARHRNGGGCTNNRTIGTEQLEGRVLAGLQERMLDPELVSVFVREYHQEYSRRSADRSKRRSRIAKRHDEAIAKVNRLVEAIANGADAFVEIKAVLASAREERDRLEAELREIDALPVIALHPGIAEDYRRQVRELARALTADEEARLQTAPIVRGLIDRVVINPNGSLRGVNIEVFGKLANLLSLATGEEQTSAMYAVGGAGEGNRTLVFSLGSCCSTIELHPHHRQAAPMTYPGGTGQGKPVGSVPRTSVMTWAIVVRSQRWVGSWR
jgi:site-specific DNA recombinase